LKEIDENMYMTSYLKRTRFQAPCMTRPLHIVHIVQSCPCVTYQSWG